MIVSGFRHPQYAEVEAALHEIRGGPIPVVNANIDRVLTGKERQSFKRSRTDMTTWGKTSGERAAI